MLIDFRPACYDNKYGKGMARLIVQISAWANRYGKPFGFGTRWGLQMYPWGMSLPEPCAPLRYVTGRNFNFFFLNSFIISLIPSQIIESTIWYESCKWRIIVKEKYQIWYCHQDHPINYICSTAQKNGFGQ